MYHLDCPVAVILHLLVWIIKYIKISVTGYFIELRSGSP